MTLVTLLTLLLRSLTVTFTILLFYISFFLDTAICSIMAFPSLENSDHVTVCFRWVSVKLETGCTVSSHMTILVLIGTAFVIIWEMFRGKIYLNSLLLLLVNFMSGFKLELSGILILNIRPSLTLISMFFSCLRCVPYFVETTFSFVSTE